MIFFWQEEKNVINLAEKNMNKSHLTKHFVNFCMSPCCPSINIIRLTSCNPKETK